MFNHKPTSQILSVLLIAMFLLTGVLPVQAEALASPLADSGNFVWAKSMGGTSGDYGNGLAVDSSGNIYTTGYFLGTADFDPGPGTFNLTSTGENWDIFISKLDSGGNFVWARSMGGTSADQGYGIALDSSDNVYTTGYFFGTADFDPGPDTFNLTSAGYEDIFVSKLDRDGNFIWARSLGGTTGDDVSSLALDSSDNVYTTGYFNGTADFDPGAGAFNLTSAGDDDVFVSKLDSSGNFVWARNMGGTNVDRGNSLALDAGGNVYTMGIFEITADFDPGPGTFNLTSTGSGDIFISKLDSNGNFVWAKRMGGTGADYGNGLAVDSSGNVYTTGNFSRTADFDPGPGTFNLISTGVGDIFVSKLDSDGNFIWARSMGGTSNELGYGITVDLSGNVYTTGSFEGTADFDPGASSFNLTSAGIYDIFISKLDSGGNFVWAKGLGGTGSEIGYGIAVDSSSNVYTTGYFAGTADFDPGPGTFNLTSAGQDDIFVSKLGMGTSVISGHAGIGEATLTYTGGSTIADGSGNYSFLVPHGWTGTITPSKADYFFSPASITISTPVTANLTGQNFTATSRAFGKTSPANSATGLPANPSLSWGASSSATSYEYCIATSAADCTTWVYRGTSLYANTSGLSPNTTYYWQVRAKNSLGLATYANGSETGHWSFTTGGAPGAFNLTTPSNGATGQPASLTLTWAASEGATSYEYCLVPTGVACTTWIPRSSSRYASVSGLSPLTTYDWLVRARNSYGVTYANGSDTSHWSFTTGTAPGAFNLTAPVDGATGQPASLTLTWAASEGATSYEYCLVPTGVACTTWIPRSSSRYATVSGLSPLTTYDWLVRARNSYGVTSANGSDTSHWSFTTVAVPGVFNLTTPVDGATGQPASLTLTWAASEGATSYEYCLVPTGVACTTWIPRSSSRYASVSGLSPLTTYDWLVRARNSYGVTSANGSDTSHWSFTTGTAPGAFNLTAPVDGATGQPASLTLTWAASEGATSYEYCLVPTGVACTTWIPRSSSRYASVSGLSPLTTYDWLVRARNSFGVISANTGTWWSFTTGQ